MKLIITGILITSIFMFTVGFMVGRETTPSYFVEGSERFLYGKKLNLPEEFIEADSTDCLAIDTTNKFINLHFKH